MQRAGGSSTHKSSDNISSGLPLRSTTTGNRTASIHTSSSSLSLRSLLPSSGGGGNRLHNGGKNKNIGSNSRSYRWMEKVLVVLCFLIAGLLLPILFSGRAASSVSVTDALQTEVDSILYEANVTMDFVEEEMQIDPQIANASWQSTAKLLCAMLLGVITSYCGILDSNAVQALAKLTYYVFMPALVLVSTNTALAAQQQQQEDGGTTDSNTQQRQGLSSRSLLLMPVMGVVHVILGYAIGRLLTYLHHRIMIAKNQQQHVKSRHHLKNSTSSPRQSPDTDDRDVWMNCAFGNATPLPLVIATSLFPSHTAGSAHMAADMAACISFYTIVEAPFFYTLGAQLLLTPAEKLQQSSSDTTTNTSTNSSSSVFSILRQTLVQSVTSLPILAAVMGVLLGRSPALQAAIQPGYALAPLYASVETFSHAYLPSTILVLAGSMMSTSNTSNSNTSSNSNNDGSNHDNNSNDIDNDDAATVMTTEFDDTGSVHSAATAASAAARALLASPPTSLNGNNTNATTQANNRKNDDNNAIAKTATIPKRRPMRRRAQSTPEHPTSSADESSSVTDDYHKHGISSSSGGAVAITPTVSPTTVALTCLCRFVLLPLASMFLLKVWIAPILFVNDGNSDSTAESPRNQALISLVWLMQGSMPPAQNSALLLTLANCPLRAARLTKTLTMCYILSIIPVTIWMSWHLQATHILEYA